MVKILYEIDQVIGNYLGPFACLEIELRLHSVTVFLTYAINYEVNSYVLS